MSKIKKIESILKKNQVDVTNLAEEILAEVEAPEVFNDILRDALENDLVVESVYKIVLHEFKQLGEDIIEDFVDRHDEFWWVEDAITVVVDSALKSRFSSKELDLE